MTMIKTTFGVYLLLEKRHNENVVTHFWQRIKYGETSAIYSTFSSSTVSFIMVHLIKPTRLMAALRESCAPRTWNASKSRWEHSGERKELIGRYQKFSLTYIRGRFRGIAP